jgi:hypothetical protein
MGRALAKPIIFSRENLMGFAELVIGPATSGRTRWLYPSTRFVVAAEESNFRAGAPED